MLQPLERVGEDGGPQAADIATDITAGRRREGALWRGHRLAPPYYLGSTGYYISATPPPNIMTAARGHRKPSRARANVKGGEIASVLPG